MDNDNLNESYEHPHGTDPASRKTDKSRIIFPDELKILRKKQYLDKHPEIKHVPVDPATVPVPLIQPRIVLASHICTDECQKSVNVCMKEVCPNCKCSVCIKSIIVMPIDPK